MILLFDAGWKGPLVRQPGGLLAGGLGYVVYILRVRERHGTKLVRAGESGCIPAAAQSFDQIHGGGHAPLQNGHRGFFVAERDGLGGDDVEIRIRSRLIAVELERKRLLGGRDGLLLLLRFLGEVVESREVVLHLLKRGENGLPVCGDSGIVGGFGSLQLCAAASEVEQGLRKRRSGGPRTGSPCDQVLQIRAQKAGARGEGQGWVIG